MLGARIATLRRKAGWSQSQLAETLQISPSAVGMYEQGRREPSADLLVAMAHRFGVSVDYLLTGNPGNETERQTAWQAVCLGVEESCNRKHGGRAFSRQEMVVLFAALMMDT